MSRVTCDRVPGPLKQKLKRGPGRTRLLGFNVRTHVHNYAHVHLNFTMTMTICSLEESKGRRYSVSRGKGRA